MLLRQVVVLQCITCSMCFEPSHFAPTRRAYSISSSITMGKARAGRVDRGFSGGFGQKDKQSDEVASLNTQLEQLVAQLNAQGNELADSQVRVEQLRAENVTLRSKLAKAGIAIPTAATAAAPASKLWDDGYEDDNVSAFTMDELLGGKVPGASVTSPPP